MRKNYIPLANKLLSMVSGLGNENGLPMVMDELSSNDHFLTKCKTAMGKKIG